MDGCIDAPLRSVGSLTGMPARIENAGRATISAEAMVTSRFFISCPADRITGGSGPGGLFVQVANCSVQQYWRARLGAVGNQQACC